jgi:hypothetical protein
MLPVEQETHEILQRHRFDFPAQTLDRVAVNTRQQMSFAPFFNRQTRGEPTAQHVAFTLQSGECLMDRCGWQ